jgi:uncharacterized repeat protein (TIGR03803 family)
MSKFCTRVLSALGALASNQVIRGFLLILALFAVLPVHVQAQFTVLKHRSSAEGSDGFSPLVFANNKLFGTTRSGGQSSYGVVFSMNVDGTGYAVLHSFNNTDGSSAYSGVIVGSDAKLYGVTYTSSTGGGVIYRLNTDGTGFTILRILVAADGVNSWGGLLQAADGKLYGVAVSGGANSRGTAYRINLDGTGFTVVHNFDTAAANPYGTLVQGLDGKLYGTTSNAAGGTGAIYRMNIDGSAFQVLHTLISTEGQNPRAGLMQTSDGKLYGTSISGGPSAGGSIYALNADGTGFTVLKSFSSASSTEGYDPYQVVPALGSDGRLYGGNYLISGVTGGTIWSINTDGTGFKVEATLSNTVTGYYPLAGVQKAPDGAMYGQTYNGGTNGAGTIFRLSRPGIGVNFTGGQWAVAATSEPGVQPGANWNNLGGTTSNTGAGVGSDLALVDHGNLSTTAKLTYRGAYDAGYGGYSGLSSSNAGTNLLYRGGIYGDNASREASATVTGIPYAYYDVYVYASDEGSTNTLSISNGATTYYSRGTGAATNSVSTLVQTTSTDSANPTVGPAQYAVFRGLTSSSFTLTTGGSLNGIVAASMLGFQIVPGTPPAVPAPVITSATTASATYNSSLSYQITASNSPTSFGATNLPVGLSVSASGLVSGTVTAAAGTSYSIGISATNATGTGSATLALTVNKASAAVVLSNLTQTYDGSTKSATVTTAPAGQPIDISYTGAVLPPVAAGSYGVLATIKSTSSYTGSASGTLAIQPATATIALGSLAQFFDGSPKSVSATTTPPGLPVSITYDGSATAPSGVGSYAVVATVTNPNYTGSATGTLTITDNVPPVLTLPTSPVVAEATSPAGASVTYVVSANDNVDGPVAVTASPVSGSTFPVGNTTVTATAHDAANNVANGSFVVSVVDTTPPILTVPANQTIEATSAAGAVATFAATATDAVSSVTFSYTMSSGSVFALGVNTIGVTATDASGNASTGTFTVNVVDSTAPQIDAANVVAEATSAAGAIVIFSASATDLVDGAVAVTSVPASGSVFPLGNTTAVLAAQDAAGNIATSSVTVSVVDTTKPTLTLPADITAEATGPNGAAVSFSPTATDAVGIQLASADFETPVYSTNTHNYVSAGGTGPAGDWTFKGYGGFLAGNGGGFGPLTQVDGQQCAFVQSYYGVLSSLETTHKFRVVAGAKYVVQFQQATRSSYPGLDYNVTLNGPTGRTEIFRRSAASGEGWARYTATFTATTSGDYTLSFNNLNSVDDATFFIDDISFYSTAVPVVTAPTSGSRFALGTTLVNASATDTAGNAATGSFNVTVKDTTPPVIAVPANILAEATSASGAVVTFASSASDIVDGSVAVAASPASGSTFPIGTTSVTLTATDGHNNTSTSTFTVTVKDTTAPALTLSANQTVEATSAAGAIATFAASATDAVSNATLSYSIASGSTFALGTTPVTVTATDAAGNGSSGTFTITVVDTTAPVIAPQDNLVIEATSAAGAVATFNPSALDIVSGAVSVTSAPVSGSTFALGTTTVALSAHDSAGNTGTSSFTVTVRDTTAPVLSVPSNQTLEATSAVGSVATFTASATDAVSAVTLSYSIASGSTFALGATPVTVTATDASGNASSGTFTITVKDTTPPVITAPANIVTEATSASGAVATFTASAIDTVSGPVSVTSDIVSGSTFALGTTTVNITATDAAGNASSGSFTVTVRDTTAPVIAPQANLVIEATGANGAVATFTPSATDIVSGNVAVLASIASGSTFPLGTTAVTLTARDAAGNVSSVAFTVTVQDTTAPIVATQDNLIVEATSAVGAVVTFTPSAIDIVNGAVTVVASPASGSTFALGTTTVTLTATDAAGNKGSKTFTVTVRDTKAPVISSPGNLIAEATSASGAAVSFSASATDLVDGAVSVSSSVASGSTFAIGTTTVTLTSNDAAGNTATTTFTVTVRDTTKPVLTLPANQTLEATGPAGAVATYLASATDAVGASLSYSVASGSVFALGLNTVTVTATDAAGNSASGSFTVNVRDTTKPNLNVPASFSVEATSAAGAIATFATSANDLVSGAVPVTLSKVSGTTFAIGATTVNVSATDAAGNTSTGSFVITVRDTTAPVLTLPANLTIEATSASGATATFAASATDAVGATLTYSKASGSIFAMGTAVVTVTATDAAGNASSGTFTVKVVDTTKPVITSLTPSTASLWPANHKMVSVTIQAVTSDVAGTVTTKIISVTSSEPDNGLGDGDTANDTVITGAMTVQLRAERSGNGTGRTYSITVEAKDAAGNTSTRVVTVSVPKNQS